MALGFGDHVYLSEDQGQTWRVAAVVPEPITALRFSLP